MGSQTHISMPKNSTILEYEETGFFPQYDLPIQYVDHAAQLQPHVSDDCDDASYNSLTPESSRSSSPSIPIKTGPADDIAIRIDPDRHVDYLSHEWLENDIWSSWRQVTKQKAFLQSGVRLENASWRTWAKSRNNLKTISPETLNWLKDCDVTWLYGPLHRGPILAISAPAPSQTDMQHIIGPERRTSLDIASSRPRFDTGSSHYIPVRLRQASKPILKKRSNSEMMLARHNLTHTYNQNHPVYAKPEGCETSLVRPMANRTYSAQSALRPATKQRHFREETGGDLLRRRIHFNESVEQCISITKSDPDDPEGDSDSSDDAPTMRISAPRPPSNIAKLPSTKLKLPMRTAGEQHSFIPSANEQLRQERTDHTSGNSNEAEKHVPNGPSILPNYDGIEIESPPSGIFGRAAEVTAEVVTSARDLVGVIWNVGSWRRN